MWYSLCLHLRQCCCRPFRRRWRTLLPYWRRHRAVIYDGLSRRQSAHNRRQRRSQDFCLGGTRYIFRHLSGSRPHSVGGGVAEMLRDLRASDQIQWGGGVVANIFPVNKSITFPRFRDILFYIFGPPADDPPFMETHGNSGTLPRSAYTFKPRNNINLFRKKTFTKSLGGMTPLPPWLRH